MEKMLKLYHIRKVSTYLQEQLSLKDRSVTSQTEEPFQRVHIMEFYHFF